MTALKVVLLLAVLYGFVVMLAWRFQERMVFPAPRGLLGDPSTAGIQAAEQVAIPTFDGLTLQGWFLAAQPELRQDVTPALIWFPGNMETVRSISPVLRALRPHGIAVLAVDYRGYGENAGKPTEAAVYRDAESIWSYLTARSDVDSTRIAVYGRSVGSAPALHLAGNRAVRAVVLDSPFTSARDMAAIHYRFLPTMILRMELNNIARAAALDVPLLVLHGARDAIAPVRMGRAIAEAGRARQLVVFDEGGHNDLYTFEQRYRSALHVFLSATLGRGPAP